MGELKRIHRAEAERLLGELASIEPWKLGEMPGLQVQMAIAHAILALGRSDA